ncbi:Ureidoglycolate lyase [Varicellaria rhodocarpa]|nr:Ureidoglycolate lyase [Varicellaria rhodocarpa]
MEDCKTVKEIYSSCRFCLRSADVIASLVDAMLQKHVLPYLVNVEALTASEFKAFGTVIEDPMNVFAAGHQVVNHEHLPTSTSANQGTALKYVGVSPVVDRYRDAPRTTTSKSVLSLFICSPREFESSRIQENAHSRGLPELRRCLELSIMERHLYTTQTFIPLGLSSTDQDTAFLIVVAPTLTEPSEHVDTPDATKIRAFLARGSQAVTYGPGTWHAPMMVVGKENVTFVVMQHVNGFPEDDCEEIEFLHDGTGGIVLSVSPTLNM